MLIHKIYVLLSDNMRMQFACVELKKSDILLPITKSSLYFQVDSLRFTILSKPTNGSRVDFRSCCSRILDLQLFQQTRIVCFAVSLFDKIISKIF